MADVLEAPVREVAKEPAKRWRNWWRLYPPTYVRCNTCLTFHRAPVEGKLFDYGGCCQTYESQFEAELDAKEEYNPSCDQAKVEYLGAFPEGERPSPDGQEGG